MPLTFPGMKRPLEAPKDSPLRPVGLWVGKGNSALEIAVFEASRQPTSGQLHHAWMHRHGGRAAPLLAIAWYPDESPAGRASVCGPTGENPPVLHNLEEEVVRRIGETALAEPDRHTAIRFLRAVLPEASSKIPGIRNEGFLATHELEEGVPQRLTWDDYAEKAGTIGLQTKQGKDLVNALGFQVQEVAGPVSLLLSGPRKIAVAAFLDRSEVAETPSPKFSGLSPISYAITRADAEGLPYVIVTSGSMIRLYPTRPGVGVGQRGVTDTYVEAHLNILPADKLAYLWYIFSADALKDGGTLDDILAESRRFTADLGKRLRERIYDEVIPRLATGIARARKFHDIDAAKLDETFQMALLLLFRLLFVAYAEDKELLPFRSNETYRVRSLKHKAQEIRKLVQDKTPFDESSAHWEEVFRLFDAVDEGRAEWGVPAYNGGLFSHDPKISPLGAKLKEIRLINQDFGPVLSDLLLDESREGYGPIDFRSLGVREFGTIYEGILESELGLADGDLALDREGVYRPAKRGDEIVVRKGEFYLSSTSGARKSTGSYFTKNFAVEHLLDYALEPALARHVTRLDTLDEAKAGEAFFDFRVADIAMGSGHFLVAAVDRIEKKLSGYLAKRPLPAVSAELARLRQSAHDALGALSAGAEIEDAQLLRRQIARRCIYGVDLKHGAADLARVSIWIHTFVPGLPLSLLDQHLVVGNSLVGIATADEAVRLLEGGKEEAPRTGKKAKVKSKVATKALTLFHKSARDVMRSVADDMIRVARLGDATAAEVRKARAEWEKAKQDAEPWRVLMDILAAARVDEDADPKKTLRYNVPIILEGWLEDPKSILTSEHRKRAAKVLGDLPPFHFLVAFPEVFWREGRPGFDVILGNPPWEEATVEEDKFWSKISPGLSGLPQHEQEELKKKLRRERKDLVARYDHEVAAAASMRAMLTASDFPGMGTGDPDLYKAFCWRFWHLLAPEGSLGVVLPRSAFAAKGSAEFRKAIFHEATVDDLTFLLNNKQWVFDTVHPQYTIGLVALHKAKPGEKAALPLRGPFSNLARFLQGTKRAPTRFPLVEALSWTDTAALPLLPSDESAPVFAQLRKAPRLDTDKPGEWRARAQAELHATNDKKEKGGIIVFDERRPKGFWPVFAGESFDIWQNDTGSYYGWVEPKEAREYLQQKRRNSARTSRSAFSEFPEKWINDDATLPCLSPRIAFRDISRATDTRTIRAALVPGRVALSNTAPYLLWPRGNERDQAYLLGVMCSLVLDWYARRFVETHLNYHVLAALPVPRDVTTRLVERAIEIAGRLASEDERFSKWAEAVGVECGLIEPLGKREDFINELDAVVAHLYGLSEAQLTHIFETFHEGWDYKARLESTLRHFRKIGGQP